MREKNPIAALERLSEAALAVFIDADDRGETTGDDGRESDDWRELRLALIETGALPNAPRPTRFDAAVEVISRISPADLLTDRAVWDVLSSRFRTQIDDYLHDERGTTDELDELFHGEDGLCPSS